MNCKDFIMNIDAFLDGELDDKKAAEFEIHFTSCNKCHDELQSIDKCSKVLRSILKAKNPPKSIKDKVFQELDQTE